MLYIREIIMSDMSLELQIKFNIKMEIGSRLKIFKLYLTDDWLTHYLYNVHSLTYSIMYIGKKISYEVV